MVWVSASELRRREAVVLATCADLILTRPLREVTIKAVAELSGLPTWAAYGAIRRLARDRDHLLRRAVLHISQCLAGEIARAPAARAGVLATIEAFVAHMAAIVKGDVFGGLFRVVLCEGTYHPWLHDSYEQKVAGAFCRKFEALVTAASRGTGVAVLCPAGMARDVLRRLEADLILPSLLPGEGAAALDEEALVKTLARDAFARTRVWDLGEAA